MFYCYLDPYFNTPGAEVIDDKNLYGLIFRDLRQPKTIARKIDGLYMDEGYEPLTLQEVIGRCMAQGSIIVKVAVESSGGMGIRIWNSQDGMERLEKCLSGRDFIIQELVSQHESLSALHPSSVNTLRIISLIWKGEVRILSRILRMDGGRCTSHPDTGVVFKGYHVPGIDRCDAIIHREAWRLAHTCKLASWDFCIGKDGEPILIEVNMSYGGISLHQITNGPLFGPLTREIVDTVFGGKKGKRLVQRIF